MDRVGRVDIVDFSADLNFRTFDLSCDLLVENSFNGENTGADSSRLLCGS